MENHGFQDYTISSTLEKFVAALENVFASVCKNSSDGRAKAYSVAHGFPFRKEPYILTHIPVRDGDRKVLENYGVKFHEWFFVEDCIVVEPDSYSRRILSLEEYHTIVSAVCVALDNLLDHQNAGCACPVYIPMHDALRDAYGGIGKTRDSSGKIVVKHFQCDSIHGRIDALSHHVSELRQRLVLFSQRLRLYDSESAGICAELAESCMPSDLCLCSTKKTYHMYHHGTTGNVEYSELEGWDVDLPWTPWVSQDDPVGGVEIDIIYNDWKNTDRVANHSCSDDLVDGSSWRLFAMDADHAPDTGDRSFLTLQVADTSRKFLRIIDIADMSEDDILNVQVRMSGEHSFCAKLERYMEWYYTVQETAVSVQSLTEDEWWMEHAESFDHAIHEDDIEKLIADAFVQASHGDVHMGEASGIQMSLFERFSLNATIPDSLRGLAQLWMRFVHYIKEEYIENKRELPCMEPAFSMPALRCCPIVRAIAALNYCVRLMTTGKREEGGSMDSSHEAVLGIKLLDHPDKNIKVPITQTIPPDILETGLRQAGESRSNLYKSMLLSDMQAFKAANHGCRFEDFIRWYSPRDWIESDEGGGMLSKRMTGDSAWTSAWVSAEPTPVASQSTLFDPLEEAENIIQQLISIEPLDLISQMSLSLFSAACQLLTQSPSQVVQRQVERLIETANQHSDWLSPFEKQHTSRKESSLYTKPGALKHGFGLFNALSCVEHVASAVASLHQRLAGIHLSLRTKLVEGMIESSTNDTHGYDLEMDDAESLAACDIDGDNTVSFDGPVAIEHSIEIRTSSDAPTMHRIFISRLPREVRMATSMTYCS